MEKLQRTCRNTTTQGSTWQRPLTADPSILTVLTVAGVLVALAGIWPLEGGVAAYSSLVGLTIAYLAGGLTAAWRALEALWQKHILDIDLLMVVAAAAVGATFEGAVLLTLFSAVSGRSAIKDSTTRRARPRPCTQ